MSRKPSFVARSGFAPSKAKPLTGFTLIELLVVISIIGLLASIVMASLNSAREKGKYAVARAETSQLAKIAVIAQGESGARLQDITGSKCSNCVCRGTDIRNISVSSACYTQWAIAVSRIQTATGGLVQGADRILRDPWGSPYMLDENEREFGAADCRLDEIQSAGPNGLWEADSIAGVQSCTGDDICFFIPPSRSCP